LDMQPLTMAAPGSAGHTLESLIEFPGMTDQGKTEKARQAMDCLLMAYSAMMEYTWDGAHELRQAVMEIIHSLEHQITEDTGTEVVETGYDEEETYGKEIVVEDGQFCVRSKDGTRSFGCYVSRAEAEERLDQVESFSRKLATLSDETVSLAFAATWKALRNNATYLVSSLAGEELLTRELSLGNLVEEIGKDSTPNLVSVLKAEQRYTMGPVYVPGLEDAHGETITATDLQESIWEWVRKDDRRIYLQHSEKVAGEMVEILTMPWSVEASLVVPGQGVSKYQFPENTPFMGVVWEPWAWELVKAGELRGYSIGGEASRVEIEIADGLAA